jgi:hypothetical protein
MNKDCPILDCFEYADEENECDKCKNFFCYEHFEENPKLCICCYEDTLTEKQKFARKVENEIYSINDIIWRIEHINNQDKSSFEKKIIINDILKEINKIYDNINKLKDSINDL